LLIALHLHDSKAVRLTRPVGPSAQQRRLPAAGRSRDDRHLPRGRAIQRSEKITPVDQPESCPSHRHRPALISTPGLPHYRWIKHLLEDGYIGMPYHAYFTWPTGWYPAQQPNSYFWWADARRAKGA
jgi:hypothetical protein